MPIRPENKDCYPADWPTISLRIRTVRAAGRCECTGWCGATPHCAGRCEAVNATPHPLTGSKVVLTVAHLNRQPEDCRDENLAALCQRCHLVYDAEQHKVQASHTRAVKATAGLEPLFPDPTREPS